MKISHDHSNDYRSTSIFSFLVEWHVWFSRLAQLGVWKGMQADKVLAHNEEGKLDATEGKHEGIAEAEFHKEHKLSENACEKLALERDLDARKAAAENTYKNMDTGIHA